jgi:hypothetical protein
MKTTWRFSSLSAAFLQAAVFSGANAQSSITVLNDPLMNSTLGVRSGGSFVSKGGWQVVGEDNMIVYDLGQYVENGSLELDVRNFDPRNQNKEKRHHFLAMFRNPWGTHHPAEDGQETVWDLHAGTRYSPGLKLLSWTYRENESVTEMKSPTWSASNTYRLRVTWSGKQLKYYRDDVLYATHNHSDTMQLRYVFLGRDLTVSGDLVTNYKNNQYPAIIGPIYSSLLVKRTPESVDTTPPTLSNISPPEIYANATRLSWTTNEATSCHVEYGLSSSLDETTTILGPPALSHETTLAGLVTNQTYYFRIIARDKEGNVTTSERQSFRTSSGGNYLFHPIADAFVEADGVYNSTRSYGNYGWMHLLLSQGRECYLRFNVAGVSGNIVDATLRLHGRQTGTGAEVRVFGGGWSESDVTWRKKPNISGPKLGELPSITIGEWSELSVTAAVNGNGSYNFALIGSGAQAASVDSRESLNFPPELIVTTSSAPVEPVLQITSPNGGESWITGGAQAITWVSQGTVAEVNLEFSLDGGASWTTIIEATANDGSYNWSIPDVVSDQCLIRVSDAADGEPFDVSDGLFAIVSPPAISNYALGFDGVNDYVEIADNALLSGGPGKSLTVEAWVKPRVISGTRPLASKYLDGKWKDWGLQIVEGALEASIESNGDNWVLKSGSISPAQWTHVAFVFANQSNLVRIYINGAEAGQKSLTKDMPDTKAVIRIGRHGYVSQYFDGDIDELRIWNYARSAAQLNAAKDQEMNSSEPGLIGYWQFNDGSGQSAADLTSNGNAGRLGTTSSEDAADPQWVISDAVVKGGSTVKDVVPQLSEANVREQIAKAPSTYVLHQNYPNPFNPETRINYEIPSSGYVRLSVYDVLGREVVRLFAGDQAAGQYSIAWNGRDHEGQRVSSGIYYYLLQAGSYKAVKSMLIVQ